jgi:hypothetical protein
MPSRGKVQSSARWLKILHFRRSISVPAPFHIGEPTQGGTLRELYSECVDCGQRLRFALTLDLHDLEGVVDHR